MGDESYKRYKQYKTPTYVKDILPLEYSNNLGIKMMHPQYIVIHEVSLGVGQTPESYNAEYYRNKLKDAGQKGSEISYHFLASDDSVYQFLPIDTAAYHCGVLEYNYNSIGIERLVCKGINYELAIYNQAIIVASLMKVLDIPIENVCTHKMMQAKFSDSSFALNYEIIKGKKLDGQYEKVLSTYDYLFYQDELDGLKENIAVFNSESDDIKQILLVNLMKEIFDRLPLEEQAAFSYDACGIVFSKFFGKLSFKLVTDNRGVIDDGSSYETILNQVSASISSSDKFQEFQNTAIRYPSLNPIAKVFALYTLLLEYYKTLGYNEQKSFNMTIGNTHFFSVPDYKNCPSRMIAGQRGGFQRFKQIVSYCYEHEIFIPKILEQANGLGLK